MRKKKILILGLLILLFIWGNSLLPASASLALSNWLRSVLQGLSAGGIHIGGTPLRKLAHFIEFATLGMVLCWIIWVPGMKTRLAALLSFCFGALAACLDEALQFLAPNRGPSLKDVALDVLGLSLGIGLFLIWNFIKKQIKHYFTIWRKQK